jgi:quinolinate synthase
LCAVQAELRRDPARGTQVEIVFPVAADAVAPGDAGDAELAVVPGVQGGEGCSTAGGCATCPYMKMNSLDALLDVARLVIAGAGGPQRRGRSLAQFEPQVYGGTLNGHSTTAVGSAPILHMRALMAAGRLSDAFQQDVLTRRPGMGCPEVRTPRAAAT